MAKKYDVGSTTQAYVFEITAAIREGLLPLANDWGIYIRHHSPADNALQLAAYQSLVQKKIDRIETISKELNSLQDQVEEWEDNSLAMEE